MNLLIFSSSRHDFLHPDEWIWVNAAFHLFDKNRWIFIEFCLILTDFYSNSSPILGKYWICRPVIFLGEMENCNRMEILCRQKAYRSVKLICSFATWENANFSIVKRDAGMTKSIKVFQMNISKNHSEINVAQVRPLFHINSLLSVSGAI